ncbi:uncharacterized protein YgbK (DUF1537 family) [Salibacterium salarium]|uniref:four-carbon acid sugar kinase family protein n=1 Tax=Salibacterium salarium TaxID=284579 RepID=UPI00277FA1FB|nr:four-carbon acid sugar kinase family protein [Salibacterium salarium]MDQ0300360.1 uncharacterized protein YgbK (DUF1537 family) [Salibacterium salarium]
MKISILADDLTGANDSGVQIVKYGLTPIVIIQDTFQKQKEDIYIYNTDSRTLTGERSYNKIFEYCNKIEDSDDRVIYKKIDSTMRGSIGQEVNALYDYFCPDFVIIAPGHPSNGRKIVNRMLYLNNTLLHETEVAQDPKTPVFYSDINKIIMEQSQRKVAHIYLEDLKKGKEKIWNILKDCKEKNINHITVDSMEDHHLKEIVEHIKSSPYSVIWAGSAGLIYHIPKAYGYKENTNTISPIPESVRSSLFVIGSMSRNGREQLQQLLQNPKVIGLEMQSTKIIDTSDIREKEFNRLISESKYAVENGYHLALFSSSDAEKAVEKGKEIGLSRIEVSDLISYYLGKIADDLIIKFQIDRLFLTGGDTAFQVMKNLGVETFQLMDEIEPGVPVGLLQTNKTIYTVTKAGNFGGDTVMNKALTSLKGG